MTETEGKALAERYCSGAEHCCHEVRAMLLRHKAESEDIVKVLLCAYLAGGMTKKGFRHIVEGHSAAVVGNSHICSSAVLYLNGDMLCSRVY